ncbi:MAG: glycosyltransferase family 4 protein [Nitriliruptorales bacterium]|nr:glycosyltransferase family 4 protein [Nitriliruptorales bacterium]
MEQDRRGRVSSHRRGSVLFLSWRDLGHPDAGGAEVYLDRVTRELRRRGWRVTVFTARYENAASEEMDRGVRFIRRGGRTTVYLWGMLLYLFGRLGRHDVLVDVQNGVPFLASLWSRRPVAVLNHHVHEEQWPIFFGRVLGRLGWWLESRVVPRLQKRAHYITVSAATRSDLEELGIETSRISVVHNGTDRLIAPADQRSRSPRIVVLGRLVPHKRVELALRAVEQLRGAFPEMHLDVVGGGAWLDPLEREATRLGVADIVTFHGHVDESLKTHLLHRAWVLALPSVKEGWGLVITEAAALGVPAVAFREAGGVSESIVDGATGHLVRNVSEFVDRLGQVLSDPEHRSRLGTGARAHSRAFTWTTAGDGFDDVLLALAGTSTAAHDRELISS